MLLLRLIPLLLLLLATSARPHCLLVCFNSGMCRQEKRAKGRKPMTPRTSMLKKIKMKSYKDRFRTMSDGKIRHWRDGKNHNAHLKSRKPRRRLRQPAIVLAAYAKVMKKLNFCA